MAGLMSPQTGLAQGESQPLQASLLGDAGEEVPRHASWRARKVVLASAFLGITLASIMVFTFWSTTGPDAKVPMTQRTHAAPLYRIKASGYFDAGWQHGRIASRQIHGWLATPEMQSIFAWTSGQGKQAFENLKTNNTIEFPDYAEELRGIAEGANVSLDQIWCANLLNELEEIMDNVHNPAKHCSDIYAISPGGYAAGFAHGHNDDWSDALKPYWYVLSVVIQSNVKSQSLFSACAGLAYPGALVGWAPSWNIHGIFSTQNSLLPKTSRSRGLATAFVQRRAICSATNMDEAIAGLTKGGWSDGASLNIVDVRSRRMVNVEFWEDMSSVLEITEAMGNYSHFNRYKHLRNARGLSIDDPSGFIHDLRQASVDALPPPRSAHDVMARLGDSSIFRPSATLTTVVVNGSTGQLDVWCGTPSSMSGPVYSWNLFNFFDGA